MVSKGLILICGGEQCDQARNWYCAYRDAPAPKENGPPSRPGQPSRNSFRRQRRSRDETALTRQCAPRRINASVTLSAGQSGVVDLVLGVPRHSSPQFATTLGRDETGATLIEVLLPHNVRGETLTLRALTIPASSPLHTNETAAESTRWPSSFARTYASSMRLRHDLLAVQVERFEI